MRPSSFRNSLATRLLLQRIDRAAARMTPYLVVLAIGLVLVNLICLSLLVPHLRVSRHPGGIGAASYEAGRGSPLPLTRR